ncbi:MAG: aminopeptidase, partial [Cyclobacteriaceae bacterium]
MWFNILKFEIQYRITRPATYIYFVILFLMSFLAISTDVVQIGGGAGLVKENAPTTIATMMVVISAFFMMITSAIMGVAVLRDFEHQMESIIFTNPIRKIDYLAGRFLGSFIILLLVFSGMLWGFIAGEFMPWRDADKLLPFNFWNYLQPFLWFVLPNIFFTGALFFISGALSRKMVTVYLQWIALFIVYQIALILTQEIDNRSLAAIMDPFALSTVNIETQYWTVNEQNANTIPIEGKVLLNRIIWIGLGIVTLIVGYFAFSFNVVRSSWFKRKQKEQKVEEYKQVAVPQASQHFSFGTSLKQLWANSWFYFKDILNSVAFRAIVLFGIFVLVVNSFFMGRVFGMNTYPTTYQILQLIGGFNLFFMIILVAFSGELIWKEREVKIDLIYDAMPVKDAVNLLGKFFGMVLLYVFLLLVLIATGILIQVFKGYYDFDIGVYFTSLFTNTLFFLILFTILCFFIQVLVNNKFLGYAVMILFFISTLVLTNLGVEHRMFQFASADLGPYSDMNGYGHYVQEFSWFNVYWLGLAMVLFAVSTMFAVRGSEALMKIRFKVGKLRLTKPMLTMIMLSFMVFVLSGCYIYYNTNVLNEYQNSDDAEASQADYERTLSKYQYLNQPMIVDVNLKVDLYPRTRDYDASGVYILENQSDEPIQNIHVQVNASPEIKTDSLYFSTDSGVLEKFEDFGYTIYKLKDPLQPGAKMKMYFKSRFLTRGFVEDNPNNTVVYNGTFFNSSQFPSLGYNENLELVTDSDRKDNDLEPKERSLKRDDPRGLSRDFFSDDSKGIQFEVVVSTVPDQIAVAPGYLQKEWEENGRRYFH